MRPAASPPDLDACSRLLAPPVAHRGLWSAVGAPENSLAAFEAACDAGYGVELDVRLSSDGEAMVFHDDHLARMAGAAATVAEKTARELGELRLKSSREPIPTLSQVLDRIAGRVLILIEIKSRPGEEGPLDQRVADVIDSYHGPLAVIGFNPASHAWWRAHRPDVLRGLNTTVPQPPADAQAPVPKDAIVAALRSLDQAAPHFLAPSLSMLSSDPVAALRQDGWPIVAWTARTPDQWRWSQPYCDNAIFEGFTP